MTESKSEANIASSKVEEARENQKGPFDCNFYISDKEQEISPYFYAYKRPDFMNILIELWNKSTLLERDLLIYQDVLGKDPSVLYNEESQVCPNYTSTDYEKYRHDIYNAVVNRGTGVNLTLNIYVGYFEFWAVYNQRNELRGTDSFRMLYVRESAPTEVEAVTLVSWLAARILNTKGVN